MDINWLQAAVIALFAVFIFTGWRKGFLKIVISFAGTIVVIIAVAVVSPKVSQYVVENTGIYEQTQEKVTRVFLEKLNTAQEEGPSNDETVKETDTKDSFFEDLNIPDILKKDFIEKTASEMYQALLAVVIRDYISGYIARLMINAGSFVGVYIALSVILFIIMKSSNLINHIPVIKGFNRLLGALTGAVEALVVVWVFFFVVIMFLGNSFGGRLLKDVQDSVFLTYLFNNNFLFRFIS